MSHSADHEVSEFAEENFVSKLLSPFCPDRFDLHLRIRLSDLEPIISAAATDPMATPLPSGHFAATAPSLPTAAGR